MNLEKHISTLLYSYDCVIIPGFGAFLANKNPSVLRDNSIYPPSKKIGFNGSLQKGDGLLIQTYAQINQLSFENAQREIENKISFWKNHLEKNNSLILNELGSFSKNTEGNIVFTPNDQNYLLESFGFESLRTKLIMQPASQSQTSNGIWWKAAAMIPILIGGYLYFAQPQPVANFVNEQWSGFFAPIENPQAANKTIAQSEIKVIEETTLAKVEVRENLTLNHQVIAGSFRVKSEAEVLESKLKEKGFSDAKFTQKKGSYYYVAFDTFSTDEEAQAFRKTLSEEYPDAWVLSLKED